MVMTLAVQQVCSTFNGTISRSTKKCKQIPRSLKRAYNCSGRKQALRYPTCSLRFLLYAHLILFMTRICAQKGTEKWIKTRFLISARVLAKWAAARAHTWAFFWILSPLMPLFFLNMFRVCCWTCTMELSRDTTTKNFFSFFFSKKFLFNFHFFSPLEVLAVDEYAKKAFGWSRRLTVKRSKYFLPQFLFVSNAPTRRELLFGS